MIDSVPPDQILAGESDDDDIGTVTALREDDLDAIPDFEGKPKMWPKIPI